MVCGCRPDKHRAFALEGRGSWHSLSASLAQQVFGPVRATTPSRPNLSCFDKSCLTALVSCLRFVSAFLWQPGLLVVTMS